MSIVGQQCPPIRGLTWVKGDPVPVGVANSSGPKRVLVVECWATWCPPCRDSIPVRDLSELQMEGGTRARGLPARGMGRVRGAVKKFVEGMGAKMDYGVAVDSSGEVQEGLMMPAGARGIPHAFVIDTNNAIAFSGHPMDPGFDTALRTAAAAASDRTGGSSSSGGAGAAAEKTALPLITASLEELMGMSIKALKEILTERGLSTTDCFEKGDLAKKVHAQCSSVTYYK
eukprot:XP_001693607.1 predicted protein [Chlamydomonas reinhardtii]